MNRLQNKKDLLMVAGITYPVIAHFLREIK
jgi:hypothetical protein